MKIFNNERIIIKIEEAQIEIIGKNKFKLK